MIKLMLIAGCGGFAGACARFLVVRYCAAAWHAGFPVGTFAVNMVGCLLMGLFLGLAARNHDMSETGQVLLMTGFCGGFTTFSSFAADIWTLWHRSDWTVLGLYALISVVAGVLLVWAGRLLIMRIG